MSAMLISAAPRRRPGRIRALALTAAAVLPIGLTVAGPLLAPHSLATPVTAPFAAPSAQAPLGGDQLGRDVLSRLLHGGTLLVAGALLVAVVVTGAAALVGCCAVLRPALGRIVERCADVAMLLPPLLGVMLIALAWPGGGRWAVLAAAVVLGIPYAVRVVAAAAVPLARAGYVEAAVTRGESTLHIALRELLPNLRSTVLALFGLRFVDAVYVIAMAGFLQIGPRPPAADWSAMVRENASGILLNPWAVVAPSLAIAVVAITVNLATRALAPDATRKAPRPLKSDLARQEQASIGTGAAADDTETVARVTGLEVALPDGTVLLPAVSAAVRSGQVTALTGASGSGKTTLLRALIGHLPDQAAITAGALEVLGTKPHTLSPNALRQLRRTRVAYVGQDPGSALNPRMTVQRLVAELATDRSADSVRTLLTECRLPLDLLGRRPGALSGGQQRRVALARAIARSPQILLLDEPTAGLDTALRDEIAQLLRHLASIRNLAIVVATHDPDLVRACADHVVRLTVPGTQTPIPASGKAQPPASAASTRGAESGLLDSGLAEPGRAESGLLDSGLVESGLAAHSIEVSFRDGRTRRPALIGLDFTAAAGSATAVIGPSGSGKTTLLRVLAGLHPPTSGRLTLDGQTLAATARHRTRDQQRRIQLVPQNPVATLNPRRTVGSQLARPLRLHTGLDSRAISEQITKLLAQVDLPADFADRYPGELSGGQRQRVAIARALAASPDILLCDEVTSALDHATATAVLDLLTRLREEHGTTLVVVSHEHHLITRYTDTAHLMDAGRITGSGPTAELLPTV